MPPKRASLRERTAQDAAAAMPPSTSLVPPAENPLWGAERSEQAVVELALREIMPNRRQPRSNPADADLDELAESIRVYGVIQPIIVRPISLTKYEGAGRHYELIAGERRWRASALAGRSVIPALIRQEPADHRAMLELALIENVQRQDLHPLDEAAAFAQLHSELGYSYSEIATQLGKSKAYVTNRMRLLQLDADLRELVAARPDTIKHVYELARLADPVLRAPLIAAVRDDDLSRAATKAQVDALLRGPVPPESVSQETDRAGFHKLEHSQESVSQETDRAALHTALAGSADRQPDPPSAAPLSDTERLSRDIRHLERMLTYWEQRARDGEEAGRHALLTLIDELSGRLERIAQALVPPQPPTP